MNAEHWFREVSLNEIVLGFFGLFIAALMILRRGNLSNVVNLLYSFGAWILTVLAVVLFWFGIVPPVNLIPSICIIHTEKTL